MTLDQAVLRRVEVVNVGLAAFGDAIRDQDTPVVDVDWRPPASGDPEAVAALERLWGVHGAAVEQANADVVARMEACARGPSAWRPRATSCRRWPTGAC